MAVEINKKKLERKLQELVDSLGGYYVEGSCYVGHPPKKRRVLKVDGS